MSTVNNSIRKEVTKGGIMVDRIYKNDFQKPGTLTAQIRQVIETQSFYPSKKVDSNLQDNIFDGKDFGFDDQKFTAKETRVAWIFVPENITPDVVQTRLDAAVKAGACIYKVLSAEPILDDNQKYAIQQKLRTMDDFADAQAARYPENEETKANGTANKLILDARGNVQYRRTFFFKTPQEDHDVRDQVTPYLSAKLKAELVGAAAMSGQTI